LIWPEQKEALKPADEEKKYSIALKVSSDEETTVIPSLPKQWTAQKHMLTWAANAKKEIFVVCGSPASMLPHASLTPRIHN
jgi:hypothetical protein